jgi:hypothetical protein
VRVLERRGAEPDPPRHKVRITTWRLSKREALDYNAGGQRQVLVMQGIAIRAAAAEARRGNTFSLFMLAWNLCPLSEEEKDNLQTKLHDYHRPHEVRRVEKLLIAYRRGSLVANGCQKSAAIKQVMQEFDRSHGLVCQAIAGHKTRGGIFAL